MIYYKLRKLEQHKRDIQSLIIAAYQSSAEPEIVMYRVNELNHDLRKINKEIEEEKVFIVFKYGLAGFILFSLGLTIYFLTL